MSQDIEDNRWDKWDNFSDMDLAEMWFDSRGFENYRNKINDELVLIVYFDIGGEQHPIILHKIELEEKAGEWRYENE